MWEGLPPSVSDVRSFSSGCPNGCGFCACSFSDVLSEPARAFTKSFPRRDKELAMVNQKSTGARPLRVFVRPGSKAELACRRYAAAEKVEPKEPRPHAEAIAHGFAQHRELNLVDRHGKIIRDLVYANFFAGGAAWNAQDMQNIDDNLEKAMKDQGLNNVLLQYFRGAANITSTFHRPSIVLPD